MSVPLHHVNVLTGFKVCRVMEDPQALGKIIKKAERPLLIFGPRCLEIDLGGKLAVEYGHS